MTVYYVTTGTSLSQKSRCWFSDGEFAERRRDPKMAKFDGQSLISLLDRENPDTVEAVFAAARGRSARFATDQLDRHKISESMKPSAAQQAADALADQFFDLSCWDLHKRQTLSAELSTLITMNELFDGFSDQDELHFIGGESNRVEVLMNAAVLRLLSRQGKVLVPEDCIIADYERNLDPLDPTSFFQVMVTLWETVRPTADKPPAEFVVTGGYNGVSIALAIRIKSQSTAFHYLHEDSIVDKSKNHGLVTMKVEQGLWV